MARQNETGTLKHFATQWARRGLVAVALAAAWILAGGSGVAAQANVGAQDKGAVTQAACGSWHPATGEHLTSNHLLGVYLQEQICADHFNYKVAVHNYSSNGVGSRAYGLVQCTGPGGVPKDGGWARIFGGVFIPAHGAWASGSVDTGFDFVAGVIFRPRTSPDEGFIVEVRTGCV